MPAKRIKGPTRKGGIKPPTERELDMLRDLYIMRQHQAKKKKGSLKIKNA